MTDNQLFIVPSHKRHNRKVVDAWVKDSIKQVVMLCDVDALTCNLPECSVCKSIACCKGNYRQMASSSTKDCGNLSEGKCSAWPDVPACCLLHPFRVNRHGVLTLVHQARLRTTCFRGRRNSFLTESTAWRVHARGLMLAFGADFIRQLKVHLLSAIGKVGLWVPLEKYLAAAEHDVTVEHQGEWPE